MELSHIQGQAPAPFNHLVQIMRQHSLLFYFVIAFGLTWAYEVLVFGVLHIPFSLLLNLPLTLGPMLAVFLMTAVRQDGLASCGCCAALCTGASASPGTSWSF